MAGEPTIHIIGNVGADPEMKFLDDGRGVANINVAVTPRRRKGDEWVDQDTMWFRVAAFGHLANIIVEGVQKGNRVSVHGSFSAREWETKEGQTRTSLELLADSIGVVPRAHKADAPKSDGNDPWANK